MSAVLDPPPVPPPAEVPRTIPPSAAKQEVKDKLYELGSWFLGILPTTWTYTKAIVAHAFYFVVIGFLYQDMLVRGLKEIHPWLAVPMHKTGFPYVAVLGHFQETRGFLMANLAAALLLLFATMAWETFFLMTDRPEEPTIRRQAAFSACAVLMIGEPLVFWWGIYKAEKSVLSATLLSLVLLAMIVFSSLKLSTLWPRKEMS